MKQLTKIFKKYYNEPVKEGLAVQDPDLSIWTLNKLCEKYNLHYDIERDFRHEAIFIINYKD